MPHVSERCIGRMPQMALSLASSSPVSVPGPAVTCVHLLRLPASAKHNDNAVSLGAIPFCAASRVRCRPRSRPRTSALCCAFWVSQTGICVEFTLNLIYRWRRGSWIVDRGRAEQWHMRRCLGELSHLAERLSDPWPSTWLGCGSASDRHGAWRSWTQRSTYSLGELAT